MHDMTHSDSGAAPNMPPPKPLRHYFVDRLRVAVFFLLIAYHVGMYYVTWDWHVKSEATSTWLEPLMKLSSPWRLGLLFMLSGVASRFMLDKFSALKFIRQRSLRLLLPLIFGMLVIVPPQSYFEVIEKVHYGGSYGDFMRLYLSAYRGFCKDSSCLTLPTWNHLWFVAYLWAYSLLLGVLLWAGGKLWKVRLARLAADLRGWRIVVLPIVLLVLARVVLHRRFPTTHALVDDWFNHAQYFFLFALGVVVAKQAVFWMELERFRWPSLACALLAWAAMLWIDARPDNFYTDLNIPFWRLGYMFLYSLMQWCAIVAACGFAHRHWQQDSPALRYFTLAIFPLYIVHQTLIVSMAHALKPAHMRPVLEAPLLMVLTLMLGLGIVELARRSSLLRPVLGLPARRPLTAATAAARVSPTASIRG